MKCNFTFPADIQSKIFLLTILPTRRDIKYIMAIKQQFWDYKFSKSIILNL